MASNSSDEKWIGHVMSGQAAFVLCEAKSPWAKGVFQHQARLSDENNHEKIIFLTWVVKEERKHWY